MEYLYKTTSFITPRSQTILRRAINRIDLGDDVSFVEAYDDETPDIHFGVDTISPAYWGTTRNIERKLVQAITHALGLPPEPLLEPEPAGWSAPWAPRVLYLDIETHSADEQWNLPREEFFRLGQYAWGSTGSVVLTEDHSEIIEAIEQADLVVAHNGHAFDFSVLYGKDSTRPLELALEGRLFDTLVYANLAFPAPIKYTDRKGTTYYPEVPESIMKWLGLDNLAFQLGCDGKLGDLKEMAKEHGGFCHIPVDDPEFREYAIQDVVTLQEVTHELLMGRAITEYDWREQLNAAIDAQNSRNGFRVDLEKAEIRVQETMKRRDEVMSVMVEKYSFPTTGKAPWSSKQGKEATFAALADYGITPETYPNWPLTATAKKKLKDWERNRSAGKGPRPEPAYSLGGKDLVAMVEAFVLRQGEELEGHPALELAQMIAELKGQRGLAEQAIQFRQNDGKVHPSITSLQRSGRKSTTKPALTTWSSNVGDGYEKHYFVPDSPDQRLVELDYSNADQRVVAAYSGDEVYLERMEEGFDGHELSGRLLYGDETYDDNPKKYRRLAKPAGHGWAYRAAEGAVMEGTGCTWEQANNFLTGMNNRYIKVIRWQNRMSELGKTGRLVNDWGREMIVIPQRSYTQSPALMGQSGTREIMVDALIRMAKQDIRLICWLKAQVHDALVFSVPETELDWAVPSIVDCMETTWAPSDGSGQLIHFPVSAGHPETNWQKAGH